MSDNTDVGSVTVEDTNYFGGLYSFSSPCLNVIPLQCHWAVLLLSTIHMRKGRSLSILS